MDDQAVYYTAQHWVSAAVTIRLVAKMFCRLINPVAFMTWTEQMWGLFVLAPTHHDTTLMDIFIDKAHAYLLLT